MYLALLNIALTKFLNNTSAPILFADDASSLVSHPNPLVFYKTTSCTLPRVAVAVPVPASVPVPGPVPVPVPIPVPVQRAHV
jgi:hypothetical protein